MSKLNLLLSLLSLMLLQSCQTSDSRGQYLDEAKIRQIEGQNVTKEDVINIAGYPTLTPIYSPNTWYYVNRLMKHRAWFKPTAASQRIVKISFDDNLVSNIEILNAAPIANINVSKEYIRSSANEQNALQHFVSNLGRFNKPLNHKSHRHKN